jgi:Cdc6-like AAA superfamily ATPase
MTDFNFIEIERKDQVERFHKFVKEGGFLSSHLFYRSTNAYICFVVGTKGSGKTVLANQMLKFFKGKFVWSSNIPIVEVKGVSESSATGDEYKGRLRIYEKIRESFESVGSFENYDNQRSNKRSKDKEIERNLSKYILEKLSKIDDGDNKKEILEAAAKGIAPLMAFLVAWVTNNPSMAIPFVIFQDLINKVAVVRLDLAAEKIFFFYEEWKSQNEAEHDALRSYYKDARESLRKDIRKIVSPKNKRIVVLFDDVDTMEDCAKDLGDIIRSAEGKILWILVGKKGRLLAFKKEWSSFIMGETIEVSPFTCDEIKTRMEKSNSFDRISQVEIGKTAEAIYKHTNGNPDLVRTCIDLWDTCDAKSKRSFKRHFYGKSSKDMTSIIETKLETLKASGEREIGLVNMLFFLGVLSGNIGNLLYRNHGFNNIENEILSAIGGETYSRIQKDGFIYRTESGHYALQRIWDSHLMTLLENAPFRKDHKYFINNVNRTAIHCLTEEQYKVEDKDVPLHEKVKHETWIRFEFARCYHKLWCDEEEAWRDIIKTLAVTWMYQPKLYPDFINVIREVSKIIHKFHREDLDALQTLAAKYPKKQIAYLVIKKYAGSDPDLLEILVKLNKRSVGSVSDSKNIIKTDGDASKDGDGERKDNKKLLVSDQDVFLISLAEIDEHIKNKEYGVAKEKINHALPNLDNTYRNHFSCKRGDCYRAEGDFKSANDIYSMTMNDLAKKFNEKDSKFDVNDANVCLELGRGFHAMYLDSNDKEAGDVVVWLDNAEICLNCAMEKKPYESRIELAEIKKSRSQWNEVNELYRHIIDYLSVSQVAVDVALEGAGEASIMQGQYTMAISYYSRISTKSTIALLNTAYVFCKSGNKSEAIRNLRLIRNRNSLDKYVIAQIEALESWINDANVDGNSSVIKNLGKLFANEPATIKQIKKDRFFEYVCSQPKYVSLIRKAAKENIKDNNSNPEPML